MSMQEKIHNEAYRTTLVCVDSYDQGAISGRFYSGQEEEGVPFHSLAQLLERVEKRLNEMNYPQAFTAVRTFGTRPETTVENSVEAARKKGSLGTFAVKVLFRQHTSWQGTLTWLEEKKSQAFRSVLELVLLMDTALGGCEEPAIE